MVKTKLEVIRFGVFHFLLWSKIYFTFCFEFGLSNQSGFALLGVFRRVLLEESEEDIGWVMDGLPWFLSRALENWAMAGGTLILVRRILFCLWKVMYLGHLTNLVRLRVGWILLPTLKFLGLFSKRGLAFFSAFFTPFLAFTPLAYITTNLPYFVT